jgi:hypothetical protein
LENLLVPVGVDETKILKKIEAPELLVDGAFIHPETIDLPTRPGTQTRRRAPTAGPTSCAISLAAYLEKVTGTCLLCGHNEDAEVNDNEKEEIDSTFVMMIRLSVLFSE